MADTLTAGQELGHNQQIAANNGRAYLAMQGDGNLVVYESHAAAGGHRNVPAWATATNRSGGFRAVMQGDGNFVVYDRGNRALWHTQTHGNAGARLVLQDDGNLVVYSSAGRALWNAGTVRTSRQLPFVPATHGFHFSNRFANRLITFPGGATFTTYGRCGGMSYAALDYYRAGIPIPGYAEPMFPSPFVPPDGHWLADYIGERQGASINPLVAPSVHKFISFTVVPDMSGWMRDDDFPKLRGRIDGGNVAVIGLIAEGVNAKLHHQVLAYGYEHHRTAHTMRLLVYDCNSPDTDVVLTWEPGSTAVQATNGYRWKGFFVHDYTPSTPRSFTRNPPPASATVTYGSTVKIGHVLSGLTLHSHALSYGHPRSSGQQQVTCFGGADDNDLWRVKGPHGTAPGHAAGRPLRNGDTIRLEHVATGRNLHTHAGFPSPVSGQQELTCFGNRGVGDANDDWRVEVDRTAQWGARNRVRLVHVQTRVALHSHLGLSHPQWTAGQQEATGYTHRDDNDWWWLLERR